MFFCAAILIVLRSSFGLCQDSNFSYSPYLFGARHTLSVNVQSIDTASGVVQLGGVDLQGPLTPFTWKWGDGIVTSGFFPQSHKYGDRSRNYIVTVVAHYSSGNTDSSRVLVRLVLPVIDPVSLPGLTAVTIPSGKVTLQSHWPAYSAPDLSFFGDNYFTTISRADVEYILSAAASIEMDFVNDDVYLPGGNFRQVVLRDSSVGGAYSIWYSTPVALGMSNSMFEGNPSYSSLFHEMGHNFTLNFPASLPYGGRIDGDANAIYSESMAQIFQHAAGYELVNNAASYGLDSDLVLDIEQSLIASIQIVRNAYDDYVSHGCPFASWNDPSTPPDETFDTFMTIAYEFCAEAESLGTGFREPVKRMTRALAKFSTGMMQAYDPSHNSAAADSFRATLMVSALSYAFDKDLRPQFKALKFPIDDTWYDQLVTYVNQSRPDGPSGLRLLQNYPNPFNPATVIGFDLKESATVRIEIFDILGQRVLELRLGRMSPGPHDRTVNMSRFSSGIYFYRIRADRARGETVASTKSMMLIK